MRLTACMGGLTQIEQHMHTFGDVGVAVVL